MSGNTTVALLPTLVAKAVVDAGYDLFEPWENGWVRVRISGTSRWALVRTKDGWTQIASEQPGMVDRLGLEPLDSAPPKDTLSAGVANEPAQVHQALTMLRSLQSHPRELLSRRLEERLRAIPETERTREVRQRVGQEVFREALLDFWDGRCAICGVRLPPSLLRASHAKPWADATDAERLDPFNGLLLTVHFDALFDKGLISVAEGGALLISDSLDDEARQVFGLKVGMRVRRLAPGHLPYLRYHREVVARGLA